MTHREPKALEPTARAGVRISGIAAVPKRMVLLLPLLLSGGACAQPAANADAKPPVDREAKKVFGSFSAALDDKPRAFGSYALGCMSGAKQLPADGTGWQTMRPSRNRAWGQPALIAYVEKLARDSSKFDGSSGLLVGDLAQPFGGPMLGGHASHQVGLDADIWFKAMPTHKMSDKEREELSADNMIDEAKVVVDPEKFGEKQVQLLRRAASYPEVARIFVNPAIKKAICEQAKGDRTWLRKVRPWWQHNYHFHVRLVCPAGSTSCINQTPAGTDDGCGKEVDEWLVKVRLPKEKPKLPPPPAKPLMLSALPKECQILAAQAEKTLASNAAQTTKKE